MRETNIPKITPIARAIGVGSRRNWALRPDCLFIAGDGEEEAEVGGRGYKK